MKKLGKMNRQECATSDREDEKDHFLKHLVDEKRKEKNTRKKSAFRTESNWIKDHITRHDSDKIQKYMCKYEE